MRWNIETNRVDAVLGQALHAAEGYLLTLDEESRQTAIQKIENTYISYIDTYNGRIDRDHITMPSVKLLDRSITNCLSDKMWLGREVIKHNLLDYAPRSYDTVQDAINSDSTDRVLFVKSRSGTAGQQVSCIRYSDLFTFELQPNYIIQEAISDIEVFENRKMVFRFFILIHNKKVLLNRHGFAVIHGVDYDANSTDYAIQVQHHGNNGNSVIRVPLKSSGKYNEYFSKLEVLTNAILPVLEDVRNESTEDRYILLGADAIPCNDGKARLVEINTYPNLLKPPVNMSVNMPMFSSMLLYLLADINNGEWVGIK